MDTNQKKGLLAPAPPADDRLNEVFARLRVDEQRGSELRKKMLFLEQNILSNHRSAIDHIKSLQQELLDTKRHLQDVEDKMITVIKELRLTARKEDVDVMRKYLDLWDPVKFVTLDQVERMINERLGKGVDIIEPEKPEKGAEIVGVGPDVVEEEIVEV